MAVEPEGQLAEGADEDSSFPQFLGRVIGLTAAHRTGEGNKAATTPKGTTGFPHLQTSRRKKFMTDSEGIAFHSEGSL